MKTIFLSHTLAPTSFGKVHLVANETQLLALAFSQNWSRVKSRIERDFARRGSEFRFLKDENAITRQTLRELDQFANGARTKFSIPLKLHGTEFEQAAWNELRKIPRGQTRTYGQQAERLGRPGAVRAIGAAHARNPISILIPCHRVLGKSGDLTGYAGGIGLKRRLLELENAIETSK